MCIVLMICELSFSSLRMRSSRSLSAPVCASTGRHDSETIKHRAVTRAFSIDFWSPENSGVIRQRDYTCCIEINEAFQAPAKILFAPFEFPERLCVKHIRLSQRRKAKLKAQSLQPEMKSPRIPSTD